MKKALVFVDGQNLFYSLKNMGLTESQIQWDSLFSSLVDENDELIRVYWYQPQKLTNPELTFDKAMRFTGKNYPGKPPLELEEIAKRELERARAWSQEQSQKYNKQLHRYDEMSIKYPVVEMVRKGIVRIDAFKQEYLGEKGVDVALAVNMIKFHEKCDKLILISGDLDYAEAIQFVKDNLKKVHLVRFFRGSPPINKSVSRTLMALADKVIDLYEEEIKSKHLI
ncbi:MAG: hypothetical protein FD134_2572, partial [Gallionellaceae bacterium]